MGRLKIGAFLDFSKDIIELVNARESDILFVFPHDLQLDGVNKERLKRGEVLLESNGCTQGKFELDRAILLTMAHWANPG